MTRLRVLLVENHRVMREGLRMIVEREAHMEVVGEADNGIAALTLTQALRPDVVVMDVSMPELNGLKATKTLRNLTPEVKILILTRHADSSYVRPLLQAGASGYVLKRSASEELVRAIEQVAAGHMYLDPEITAQVAAAVSGSASVRGSAGKSLSQREEQVLRFVARGLLTKEIAARLEISSKTVETHKANAMVKMNMASRVDIVRYAVLQGWLIDD